MSENKVSFFTRVEPRLSPSDLTRVRGAYVLAKYGHRAHTRTETDADGNNLRYFEHIRRVAIVLMDELHCYDPNLICTALLHDALEDTDDIDAAIIEQFFGLDVCRRVRLLTKIPKEGYLDRLTTADTQTIIVKICDRVDNLRSLSQANEAFQKKQLAETLQYIAAFEGRRSGKTAHTDHIFCEALKLMKDTYQQAQELLI